jgi:pimeloyl-ACP methyl ester carboxylesterase
MVVTLSAGPVEIRPGRTLYVRNLSLGDASRPPINLICLHGTAASHQQYLLLLSALDKLLLQEPIGGGASSSSSVTCWMYDGVGLGDSPIETDPNAYSDEEQLTDLHAILERVDKTRPILFMGHSYGPMGILKYLKTHPAPWLQDSLRGCIFLSTAFHDGPVPVVNGGPGIFKLPLFLLNCLQSILTESFLNMALDTTAADPALVDAARKDCNANDMWVVQQYYKSHKWLSSSEAKEILLQTTTTTTTTTPPACLVLHGATDKVIPVKSGQFVANQLQTELVVVEHASHLVLVEQPEAVAKAIVAFLSTIKLL